MSSFLILSQYNSRLSNKRISMVLDVIIQCFQIQMYQDQFVPCYNVLAIRMQYVIEHHSMYLVYTSTKRANEDGERLLSKFMCYFAIYIYIHVSGAYATSNFVEGICFQSQVTYVFEEQCQCAIGHTKLLVHFLLPLWSTHDVKDIIGNI